MNMKTRLFIIPVALLLSVALSCQPDDDFPDLDDPLAVKPTLLSGTWTAERVIQYDQEALDNGFPTEVVEQDITALFPFSDYKLTFELDEKGRPSEYSINAGDAPNFLSLTGGTWTLDDPVFATVITLSSTSNINATSFRIQHLSKDRIVLNVLRTDATDNTTVYSYYRYDFVKN